MFAKSRPETGFLSKAVTFYEDDIRSTSNKTGTKMTYSQPRVRQSAAITQPMSKGVYGKCINICVKMCRGGL